MLTKEALTPELQIERWEDRRDIKNLMGRYTYDCLIKNDKEIYESYWSRREDVCLMFPFGTYRGTEAVKGFYSALDRYNRERGDMFRTLMPEKTKDLTQEELYGVGSYNGKHLSAPCIYVADDGETAQAIYWTHNVADVMCPAGSRGIWNLGLLFIDLVYEEDTWKLWHLRNAYQVDGPHGEPFGSEATLPGPVIPELENWLRAAEGWFPKPNDPAKAHEPFAPGRTAASFPPRPRPYATWDDAQSYGV
jgi:hypothetical protein